MQMLLMTIDCADPYEIRYDENSSSWSRQEFKEYNWLFLRQQQNWANDLLRARGYLFLNDVFAMLQLPIIQVGQIVGWIYKADEADTEGFVSFGCWDEDQNLSDADPDGGIQLNINVQGPILHVLA